MKIFFNASLSGKEEFGEHYQKLHDAILKTDNEIIGSPVITDADSTDWSKAKEASNYYKRIKKLTKAADLCIFEVSYPSTSIGYEVALALGMGKPVVAFHVEDAPQNLVLESIKDDKFQLIDYKLDRLRGVVEDAIEYALEQADTRFNFFISPDIGAYLDWISKERKVPRAVFLRQLIEQDMEQFDDYEG